MRVLVFGLAVLALVACKETQLGEMSEDLCGARQYQSLVGKDRAAITEAGLIEGPELRILGPGAIVTMDHRPDRMNIDLDDAGRVTAVRCG